MEDFRRETIYFIVVDRFCQGIPAKADDQHDPTRTDWQLFWGGDLEGVIQKLDYVLGLGARAIWITPVFQQITNVVIENGVRRAPYHGYWAQDFKRIDGRLCGHPDDERVFARSDTVFDRLVGELHRRGGKLVLDIVCNHSSPHVLGGRGVLYDDGVQVASYDQDGGIWYHHLGDVENWRDLSEVQTHDLCSLSDFNEESAAYRRYIKGAITQWLDKGVDGLRVDTVKHMPLWFWQEFVSDMRSHKPGVFMFGEWFLGGVHDPESLEFARTSGMSMLRFLPSPGDSLGSDQRRRARVRGGGGGLREGRPPADGVRARHVRGQPRPSALPVGAQRPGAVPPRERPGHDRARHPVHLLRVGAAASRRHGRGGRPVQPSHDDDLGPREPLSTASYDGWPTSGGIASPSRKGGCSCTRSARTSSCSPGATRGPPQSSR